MIAFAGFTWVLIGKMKGFYRVLKRKSMRDQVLAISRYLDIYSMALLKLSRLFLEPKMASSFFVRSTPRNENFSLVTTTMTTRPASATSRTVVSIVAGSPTAYTTTAAPMPSVQSITSLTRSILPLFTVLSAPIFLAISRR